MKSIILSSVIFVGFFTMASVKASENIRVCGLFQDVGFGSGIRSAHGVAFEITVSDDEVGKTFDAIDRLRESGVKIVGCVEGAVGQSSIEGTPLLQVSKIEVIGSETTTQIIKVCGIVATKDSERVLKTSATVFELRGWKGKEKAVDELKSSEEVFVCANGKDWQGEAPIFNVESIKVLH